MFISETLSRKLFKTTEGKKTAESIWYSALVIYQSARIMSKIRHETENDMVLIKLRETVLQGWPQIKHKVDPSLREYLDFRDELSQMDGLLLKGERLIVPKSMHKEMLDEIHNVSHLGVQKCLRRAREIVFWPGINGQKGGKLLHVKSVMNSEISKQSNL